MTNHARPARTAALTLLTVSLAALSACTPAGDAASDTAAAASATGAGGTAADGGTGGTAGMDRNSNMPGMNRPAARDSNQAFLRMMSDHHEGLIVMADSVEERAQGATAKADAQKLHEKQEREQTAMVAMLRQQHQDSITPMIIPSNRMMMDTTMRATGAQVDPTFYRQVINHHREGVAMTEQMMPSLTGETRRMAEKSVADQRREIQEFERKAGQATAP